MDICIGTNLDSGENLYIKDDWLKRHTLIFGRSGFGKTVLSMTLAREQLHHHNASLVVIDPKPSTIQQYVALCEQTKRIPPERVILLDPADPDHAPPMNLFGAATEPLSVVNMLVEMLNLEPKDGQQMAVLAHYGFSVCAWYGLPHTALSRILTDVAYREELFNTPPVLPFHAGYNEVRDWFETDFANYTAASLQVSLSSISSRLKVLESNPFLRKSVSAETNAVDLGSLFETQGAVLLNLPNDGTFSNAIKSMLGGLIIDRLFAEALRRTPRCPVILAIDEAAYLMDFIQEHIARIANMARSAEIRLMVATQHPTQISGELRADLLESSAVVAFFRAGPHSAPTTAETLMLYTNQPTVEAEPLRESLLYLRTATHIAPLEAKLIKPPAVSVPVDPADPTECLGWFVKFTGVTAEDVLLEDDTSLLELARNLPAGTVRVEWRGVYAYATFAMEKPPSPLTSADWREMLKGLEKGEPLMVLDACPPVHARITYNPPPSVASPEYLAKCRERFYTLPPTWKKPEPKAKPVVVEPVVVPLPPIMPVIIPTPAPRPEPKVQQQLRTKQPRQAPPELNMNKRKNKDVLQQPVEAPAPVEVSPVDKERDARSID